MSWNVNFKGSTRQLSDEAMRTQLESGAIAPDAFVCNEAMDDWRPASIVFPSHFSSQYSRTQRPRSLYALLLAIFAIAGACIFINFNADTAIKVFGRALGVGGALAAVAVIIGVMASASVYLAAATRRHAARRQASKLAGGTFLLALVAALYGLVSFVAFLITAPDNYRALTAAAFSEDARVLLAAPGTVSIEGMLGPNLVRDFMLLEKSVGPILTVHVSSPGGLVDQALELARYVEARLITVIVSGTCSSACIVIAVASLRSYADAGVSFGFHHTSPLAETTSQIALYAQEQAWIEYRDYLRQHGVPENVLAEAAKLHGETALHWVSAETMVDHGAIKGLISGGEVVKVGNKVR